MGTAGGVEEWQSSSDESASEPSVSWSSETGPVLEALAVSSSVHVGVVGDWGTKGDVLGGIDVVDSSESSASVVVDSSSCVGDVAMLGVWVFAPSTDDDVVDDDVDEVDDDDSSPDRDNTSWAVAGAVVNEIPPAAATATAPVPSTRATPENMAMKRFGFT